MHVVTTDHNNMYHGKCVQLGKTAFPNQESLLQTIPSFFLCFCFDLPAMNFDVLSKMAIFVLLDFIEPVGPVTVVQYCSLEFFLSLFILSIFARFVIFILGCTSFLLPFLLGVGSEIIVVVEEKQNVCQMV